MGKPTLRRVGTFSRVLSDDEDDIDPDDYWREGFTRYPNEPAGSLGEIGIVGWWGVRVHFASYRPPCSDQVWAPA